jgi:hypothetical protein
MKAAQGRYGTSYPTLKEGNQVWLDGKNLKLRYPKIKLAPKWYGPFPITKVLGPVNYRLKLLRTWRIHPTFHLSLLTPYKEMPEHGPNFTNPPPDLIEGEPEYEVETIVNSEVRRNGRLYYLVNGKDTLIRKTLGNRHCISETPKTKLTTSIRNAPAPPDRSEV